MIPKIHICVSLCTVYDILICIERVLTFLCGPTHPSARLSLSKNGESNMEIYQGKDFLILVVLLCITFLTYRLVKVEMLA